jgi:anti-sigma B factor antagonist
VTRARFDATTSVELDRVVVALTGECDLAGREELKTVLLAAVAGAEVVSVDLSGVTFLDSSGLHGLIVAYHAAKEAGRQLYVVNAGRAIAGVLDISGVGNLLSPPPDGDGAHG